jgi:hypothetical protein
MACTLTCSAATALIIATIYFHYASTKSKVVQEYKKQLPSGLQILYDKISAERLRLNYYGYFLGILLSLFIIYYNSRLKLKLTNVSLICLVIVVSFFTNYFYYILSPKTTYMLDHINSPEQTKAWLMMYRTMQYNYHFGILLGIIAVGLLAFGMNK